MEGRCVEEAAVRRHGLTPKSAAFSSGQDFVWADVFSLLRVACNGKSKGKQKKEPALDALREFQIPATVLFIQSLICLAEGLMLRLLQLFELLQKAGVPEDIFYRTPARDIKHHFSGDPDRMSELQKIKQVAEHNNVVLNVVCRLGSFDSSLKESLAESYYDHSISPTLKVMRRGIVIVHRHTSSFQTKTFCAMYISNRDIVYDKG